MIRSSFIAMLAICVVCSFSGQDFVSLGRHSWRCKERINQDQNSSENIEREVPVVSAPSVPITQRAVIKCCCGKICKGNRGLKMHQRSCQVLNGLNNELCTDLEEQISDNPEDITTDDQSHNAQSNLDTEEVTPELKKGINLPKKESEWVNNNNNNKFHSHIINLMAVNALSKWNNANPVNCDETNAGVRIASNIPCFPIHCTLQYKVQLVKHHCLATFSVKANLDIFRLISFSFRFTGYSFIKMSFKPHRGAMCVPFMATNITCTLVYFFVSSPNLVNYGNCLLFCNSYMLFVTYRPLLNFCIIINLIAICFNNNNNGNFIKCFRVHTIIVNLTYSKVIYKLLLESLIIYTK